MSFASVLHNLLHALERDSKRTGELTEGLACHIAFADYPIAFGEIGTLVWLRGRRIEQFENVSNGYLDTAQARYGLRPINPYGA